VRFVVAVLIVSFLGCSGLLEPSGRVVGVDASCGAVALQVEPDGPAGVAPIQVDGAPVQTVRLDGLPVTVQLPMGAGRHEVQVGGGPPAVVDVPNNDLTLKVRTPSEAPLEGEPARVVVQVLGSCPTEGLVLGTSVAASGATREHPLGTGTSTRVDLGLLAEGRHDVEVQLLRGDVVVARELVAVPVAPPCSTGPCRDRDGDGHEGPSVGGPDCDDTDPMVFPGAEVYPDPDGDGAYAVEAVDLDCDGIVDQPPGPFDCNEEDPSIPRPEEPLPTGVDEDCDGIVDEGTTAYDDDGDGLSEEDGDCNDADPTVSPERPELPDCKDNDCDGQVDDGVKRASTPDAYEPNDTEPYKLAGAQPRRGPFGGYKPTEDELLLTVAGVRDVESFSVYAHDGSGDSFHVTARILSAGDGLTYRVSIEGPRQRVEDILGAGGALRHGGRVLGDDSGDYVLRVEPAGETPTHCPLVVELSSG